MAYLLSECRRSRFVSLSIPEAAIRCPSPSDNERIAARNKFLYREDNGKWRFLEMVKYAAALVTRPPFDESGNTP